MRDIFGTLRAAGYDTGRLPHHLEIGKWYRLPAPGRGKADRSGWVRLHDDGVASYGDWTSGEQHTWRADNDNDHRPRFDAASAARRRAQDRARVDAATAAASVAARVWDSGKPANTHPYMERKGITVDGLRVDLSGRLLVPVYHAATGALISVQRIDRDGDKRFLSGSTTEAGHFVIPGTSPCIFTEGLATAATIRAATGRAVVVCFNAKNLQVVTGIMAQPGDVVAADNDNAPKPGERFGKRLDAYGTGHRAAIATGLPWYMPHTPGQDWNDAGVEATARAFAGVPTSAAPIFDAWKLERIEPGGKAPKQWVLALAAATDPRTAAALALAAAGRMYMIAPAQISLAGTRAAVEAALPAGLVHPTTLDGIMGRLDRAMDHRKAAALSSVMIPADVLARHRHEVCDALPTLTPADYEGVIVLWAPMASGKTRTIGRPFIEHGSSQGQPIAICHRVSLVHDLARVLGLERYGEIDEHEAYDPALRGLATCLPSITNPAHDVLMRRADYLFIDEIAQVLRFLSAKDQCRTAHANNEGVYDRLRKMVARAKCIIVADAGCDARTIGFLESCRPGEAFRVIEMRQRRDGIEATYHTGGGAPSAVVGDCLAELAAGGRIWMATESSRRAKALGAFFQAQGYRAIAINADNKGNREQAAFLAAPEAESRNYDVVIASPVIGSGLSVEHRDTGQWFTLGAFIGGGHRLTPADAAQALRRVRYLRRFSLGLMPNSQVGRQASEGILQALEQAAALDGRPAFPNAFTGLVAQITADETNARADFAAGLLWQLERAGWALRHGDGSDEAVTAALAELKADQAQARRIALMAAPLIDDMDARRLEATPNRTELQNITLEAWRIRASLGVDALDDDALDFWDDGAAVRRLDRFSAWQGIVGAYDDTKDNLANRGFRRAISKAYAHLLHGIDLATDRITDAVADLVLDRVIDQRLLLARLGVVPKTYGVWMEDRDGALLPFKRPKTARKEVGEMLRRMGLAWRPITARVQFDPISLGEQGATAHKPAAKFSRVYQVSPDSLAEMQLWADRRNARRQTAMVERDVAANDNLRWSEWRLAMWAKGSTMTRDEVATAFFAQMGDGAVTFGARLTVFWLRHVLVDRLAA
jgi:putative DNA primase/helicase